VQHAERAARAEAERARELRDEMLAIVAHDLRNPVHTIMLSAGAMAELALSESENAAQLALIRRSAGGMDHLIRDLLDVTQIERGRLAIQPAPAIIDATIAEAVALCTKRAEAVGVTIGTFVEPDLPPVLADHARVVQAVGNLVANSVKFTDRGGRVMVQARKADGSIEVVVEDTGRGMTPDELPRVFDAYWQGDPTSRKGVGLGLAIVRGIVDAHGGSVAVESSPGVGSTFRFTLPLATPLAKPDQRAR
jgi:signal transduction histidine kinase